MKLLAIALALGTLVVIGCGTLNDEPGHGTPSDAPPPGEAVASAKARIASPDVSADDFSTLVGGNTTFGLELYRVLADQDDGNLFLSPHSISLALAMSYAGAAGATKTQMAEALQFTLADQALA